MNEKNIEKETIKIVAENLYQKLLEVRKSIPYIKKGSKGYNYNYTKESQLFGVIKQQMDDQGIWLDMDMIEVSEIEISIYNEKTKGFVKVPGLRVKFQFTLTNCDFPEDKIIRYQVLQDAGSDVKKIGGLQTYAMKYFLMKFFNIANDDLDPDKYQEMIDIKPNENISTEEALVIKDLLNSDQKAVEMIKEEYGVEKITDIVKSDYDAIVTALRLYNKSKENQDV